MNYTHMLLLPLTIALVGCASAPVPVAVSCPSPAPAPSVLTESVSTGESLLERFSALWTELAKSLEKAHRQ